MNLSIQWITEDVIFVSQTDACHFGDCTAEYREKMDLNVEIEKIVFDAPSSGEIRARIIYFLIFFVPCPQLSCS